MTINLDQLSSVDVDGCSTRSMTRVVRGVEEYQYINYAEQDLKDGQLDRFLINAIGNVKRAVHIRAEDLVRGFGGDDKNCRNFHEMSLFLEKCEIVRPRILRRLNELRNRVEHSQVVPSFDEVENFLDVAYLFLGATDIWLVQQPCDAEIWKDLNVDGEKLILSSIIYDWGVSLIRIKLRSPEKGHEIVREIEFGLKDEGYFTLVGLVLKGHLGR